MNERRPPCHGSIIDPNRHHPVLDIERWIQLANRENEKLEFIPRGDGKCTIESNRVMPGHCCPISLADVEYDRRKDLSEVDMGPSVPMDYFVWFDEPHAMTPQWLTRYGGQPWMELEREWPRDEEGIPLHFIAQICFADSKDLFDFELPGEIALIFGRWRGGYAGANHTLLWSNIELDGTPPNTTSRNEWELPFRYSGVIHRSRSYLWSEETVDAIDEEHDDMVEWIEEEGLHRGVGTSIGTCPSLPQGDLHLEEDDPPTVIATLESFMFRGDWPLCNIRNETSKVHQDGSRGSLFDPRAMEYCILDMGCAVIFRGSDGSYYIENQC
ncbi:MAG: DUF1963 domain-containing protein [Phycisphaerales bacterium JB050]